MGVTTQEIRAAIDTYGSKSAAARALGITRNTLRWRLESNDVIERGRGEDVSALRAALEPPHINAVTAEPMGISGRVRWLAFGCPHCPLEDPAAIDFVDEKIVEFRPDVLVHLGDGHEMDSASKWRNEYTWGLATEFKAHIELLRGRRELARRVNPNARCIFLPGNHDANLLTVDRIDKRYRGLLDYRYWEGSELRHWEQPAEYLYDPDRGVFRLGQVTFAHGYECNQSSDETQGFTLGVPHGLFVSAHTHRPAEVTQAAKTRLIPLPYWYANAGTIREIVDTPIYMYRKRRHLWGQAVVMGDCYVPKDDEPLPQERQWDAETIVFRMFNDIYKTIPAPQSEYGDPEELVKLLAEMEATGEIH